MKMQEFILNLNEETVMMNKPRSIFFFHLMLADQKQNLDTAEKVLKSKKNIFMVLSS